MVNDLDDAITRETALATILKNPETLESALQALRDHAVATNPLNRSESNPSTSTTSDWRRISVDSSTSPRRHGGSAKNAVVADVDSLLRKLSREQKRTAQLNAQLTLLEYELKKENDRAVRNERELQDIRPKVSAATLARQEAEHMLIRTQEQLQAAKAQFDAAAKEIERAQGEIDALDKERQEAEESARRARERARELLLEMKIQDARRQGWEQGRRQGLEEGIRGGEMEGSRYGRRDGDKESRMMWEAGHKRLQHTKAQRAKAEKAARKQAAAAAAAAETRARIDSTDDEEDSDEGPTATRNPEWVGGHLQQPSSRTGPYGHRGSLVSNISDPHLAGEPSPILVRSPAIPDSAPLPRPETAQSRSSRRSGGRARTSSDPTTVGGKSTPASEFDLLQQPPVRPEVLSPIAEALSQIGSSPRPTIYQTPHVSKNRLSAPGGGPGSTRSSGHTRTMSNPKSSSGSSFVAPPPEISVVTHTPPSARNNDGGLQRSNPGSIRTMRSGYPGSDELIEPLGDPHQIHPYAMAGLDKGKQSIRPGLDSSTFIPPNPTAAHNAYSVHDVPSPNLSQISGYGPTPTDPADPTRPPPSPRRRGGTSPLPATAMLPTPDSGNGMWQQTDPLVSPPETEPPGGGLQRSTSWVGGFVRPRSRDGSRTGRIMRSLSKRIQNITRPPSAQQRPPSAQSQQPMTNKYIPPGRRNSISPKPPTAPPGPADLAAGWRKAPRTTPSPQHFYGRQATIAAQNSYSTPSPVGVIPNMSTLRTGSTTPQGVVPPAPPQRSILKPPPQPDPAMISVDSSPSVDIRRMPPEVQAQVSGWRADAAARGESTEDYYPTAEERARRDARAAELARKVQAGEPVSPIQHLPSEWEIVPQQPAAAPPRSVADMMHELDESLTEGSKNSSPRRSHVPSIDVMLPPGGPGIGLGLGIGSNDVANLEREAEDYQWDARSQKLVQTPRATPFDIEVVPPKTNPKKDGNSVVLPQQNQGFLMATPRPPHQRMSPHDSPAPPPPPKVNGTPYVWADAGPNASAAHGSARMTTSQLPVDATQGGIVPGTSRSVRLSLQPDQQPQNIANSGRSQAGPLPAVTADSLPSAWKTQKTTQAQLPGTYEEAEVPAGMQYPEAPKKPGKRKKGKKEVEDNSGGVIIPPNPPAASSGPSASLFGGGGITSTGGVIPPPSPRHGGGSGFDRNGWGPSTKSGTASPWNASQSGISISQDIPPIEIVPDSPERGLVPRIEGWNTGRTLSQPLPGGNPWTERVVPSPLPPPSPGRSRVAGGFGSGGWGDHTTSPSVIIGGTIGVGGVVPAPAASATNKQKKKREGGGGWGGS